MAEDNFGEFILSFCHGFQELNLDLWNTARTFALFCLASLKLVIIPSVNRKAKVDLCGDPGHSVRAGLSTLARWLPAGHLYSLFR